MKSITLKNYQQNAVDDLLGKIEKTYKTSKEILLKAPTGSGKTVMVSYLMEEYYKINRNVCFIWISIGKSGLHEQSEDKVREFTNTLDIYSTGDMINMYREILTPGDSLFMNWESVFRKNKDKDWMNIFMKETNDINFINIIENTKRSGTDIFLIIDEAHASTSARAQEIISIIRPDIELLVTATPKASQLKECSGRLVEVPSRYVIEEGVIKKGIVVNKDIASQGYVLNTLLKSSVQRREYLKKLYENEKSVTNPLCLIQVPNGKEGDRISKEIEKALSNIDITIGNNKLAVWTTEDKINLDVLKNIDAPQEYLIFKQAIDTGWDCPRAQILLKLRDIKSETFKEQLLGRLLRMPELRHYGTDLLNYAYAYTNEESFIIDKPKALPDDLDIPTEIVLCKEESLESINNTLVPTYPLVYNRVHVYKNQLVMDFITYLDSKIDIFRSLFEDNSTGYEIEIPKNLKIESISYRTLESDKTQAKLTPGVIRYMILREINKLLADKELSDMIFSCIMSSRPKELNLYKYLNIIMFNMDDISYKLNDLRVNNSLITEFDKEDLTVQYSNLPTEINVHDNPINNPIHSKNLYKFFPRKALYKYEETIIDSMEDDEGIEWWSFLKTFNSPIRIPFTGDKGSINYYTPTFLARRTDGILLLIDIADDETDRKFKLQLLGELIDKSKLPNYLINVILKGEL